MIDPKELRIGNYVMDRGGKILRIDYWERPDMIAQDLAEIGGMPRHPLTEEIKYLQPIPLTHEVLQRLGAIKSSIENPFFSHYDFDLGRDRHLSVSNPGTPNEFVMLLEYNKEDGKTTPSVICLRNYDYDGKTYVHHLQNIYYDLSKGVELKLQTPQLAGL